VDFPFYQWQLSHGEHPRAPDSYPVGMRWRWSPGCFERLQSVMFRNVTRVGPRPSRIRELLMTPRDFSPFTREALWSWSDPMPFFAEMGGVLRASWAVFFEAAWRRCLPRSVKSYVASRTRLIPEARRLYNSLRLRDVLRLSASQGGGAASVPGNVAAAGKSFLFVCYGNLMRSPMAEAMLKHELAGRGINGVVVKSAGLHALPGREAHPWALAVSRELGMPLDQHRAQLLTPELAASADIIFAMDFENLAELEALYPTAKRKSFLLGHYAEGGRRGREIPDPYHGDIETTRRCYAVLRGCIGNLSRDIAAAQHPKELLSTWQ
jgi:protein-tyrosine-phosphatase